MFSKTAFLNLFHRLFEEEPKEKIQKLFESLGFEAQSLMSYKSRNFVLTVSSKQKVVMTSHDSGLIDFRNITFQILVRKFGKTIVQKGKEDLTSSVKEFFYANNSFDPKELGIHMEKQSLKTSGWFYDIFS